MNKNMMKASLTFVIFTIRSSIQGIRITSTSVQNKILAPRQQMTPLDAELVTRRSFWVHSSAVTACTFVGLYPASSESMVVTPDVVEALVWGKSTIKSTCITTRNSFGPKFINYLARFLLAYDTPSRRLWRSRAAEIPLTWTKERVQDVRLKQLGEFLGAVEAGLCDFSPIEGVWSSPLNINDTSNIRRLLSLLRSRYGSLPDALRQLALLFSLLPEG